MNFGLDFTKLAVIGVIALLLVGPERLPRYAEGFARLLKRGGEVMRGAKERASDELGGDFNETDWRKLDPRQYDPRRIIREALLDDAPATAAAGAATVATATPPRRIERLDGGALPPFDAEAT